MSDSLFNCSMLVFAVLMVWVAFTKAIPTGVLGSSGCIGLSVCSLMAIDNNAFVTLESIESLFLCFCGCIGVILLHVVLLLKKSHHDSIYDSPHRRRSDWAR